MGDPTNNCPIGVGANCPTVDAGTMARTQNTPRTVQGQTPAAAGQKKENSQVLASFDMENAVIWTNQALLENLSASRSSGKPLGESDTASLAHEFAHVLQHKDVFERFDKREDRATELVKRRAELIAKSSEEEYLKHVLAHEKQAEKLAQRIVVELLSHFDRSRGGSGFSTETANFLAEEKATQWIQDLRQTYTDKARRDYRAMQGKVKQEGGAQGVARASAAKKKTTQKLLPVAKIQDALPTAQSPTLAKLVKLMVQYEMVLVVSLSQEDL